MAEISNETIIAVLKEQFSNMEEKLDRIEDQTTKTNGRVSRLEEWRLVSTNTDSVNKWWFLAIGGGIVSLLGWMVEIYSNAKH